MKKILFSLFVALVTAFPLNLTAAGFTDLITSPEPKTTYQRGDELQVTWDHPTELLGKETKTTVGLVRPNDVLRYGGTIVYRTNVLSVASETVLWPIPEDFAIGEYSLLVEEHAVNNPDRSWFDWIDVHIEPAPASILMLYSPEEVRRGNTATFRFSISGAPSERFVLAVLKQHGTVLGWITDYASIHGERGELGWGLARYLTPDRSEYRLASVGEGYTVQIGITQNYIGATSEPTDERLFVVSAETEAFSILPNASNLFFQYNHHVSSLGQRDDWMSLAVLGEPGKWYELQESTDLITWETLQYTVGLEGEHRPPFIQVERFGLGKLVLSKGSGSFRFYRAVLSKTSKP